MKKFIPALIWAILIGSLSLMPSSEIPKIDIWDFLHVDKIGHAIFYMIMSALLCYGFLDKNIKDETIYWISGLISILYGIGIEVLQFYMSFGRAFEILDIIANISGAFIGLIIFNHLTKKK